MEKDNPPQQPQKPRWVFQISNTNFLIDFNKRVGSGGNGDLYRVYNRMKIDQKLCCKRLKTSNNSEGLNTLMEIQAIKLLPRHQNLVQVIKFNLSAPKQEYFIMEYCRHGDLQQQIRKIQENGDQLSEEEVFDFLQQFAAGYNELYVRKLLHCDLKPANIVIDENVFKITDYGLLTQIIDDNFVLEPRGTLTIRAPELFGSENIDSRYADNTDFTKVDMFSLGCILHNMMFGNQYHPYYDSRLDSKENGNTTPQEFMKRVNEINSVVFPENRMCSDAMKELIQKLVAKDVKQRMSFPELNTMISERKISSIGIQRGQESYYSQVQSYLKKSGQTFMMLHVQPRIEQSGEQQEKVEERIDETNEQGELCFNILKEREMEEIKNRKLHEASIKFAEFQIQIVSFHLRIVDSIDHLLKHMNEKSPEYLIVFALKALFIHIAITEYEQLNDKVDKLWRIMGSKVPNPFTFTSFYNAIFDKKIKDIENLQNRLQEELKRLMELQNSYQSINKNNIEDYLEETLKNITQLTQVPHNPLQKDTEISIIQQFLYNVQKVQNSFTINNTGLQRSILVTIWYIEQSKSLETYSSDFHRNAFHNNINLFSRYYNKFENRIDMSVLIKNVENFYILEKVPFKFVLSEE